MQFNVMLAEVIDLYDSSHIFRVLQNATAQYRVQVLPRVNWFLGGGQLYTWGQI